MKQMRRWRVYFTDNPRDPMRCEASCMTEAKKLGRQYIRAWDLAATIDRIEEDVVETEAK